MSSQPISRSDLAAHLVSQRPKSDEKPVTKTNSSCPPITIAIGVILSLGGIFLALASHQVFGINAITHLGVWGGVLGYGVLGIGVMTLIVGSVKCHQRANQIVKKDDLKMEESEVKAHLHNKLQGDECFVVDNPKENKLTFYYRAWDDEKNQSIITWIRISYNDEADKQSILNDRPVLPKELVPASMETFNQRALALQSYRDNLQPLALPFSAPPEVKKSLDLLFGDMVQVDQLPEFADPWIEETPEAEDMPFPIMKFTIQSRDGRYTKPAIAIKLDCLSTREELAQLGMPEGFRASKTAVLVLYQERVDTPLAWSQFNMDNFRTPIFFNGNFTYPNDGTLTKGQYDYVVLLRKVIQLGWGSDRFRVRWKLARNSISDA